MTFEDADDLDFVAWPESDNHIYKHFINITIGDTITGQWPILFQSSIHIGHKALHNNVRQKKKEKRKRQILQTYSLTV